jgi:hypothetical protein
MHQAAEFIPQVSVLGAGYQRSDAPRQADGSHKRDQHDSEEHADEKNHRRQDQYQQHNRRLASTACRVDKQPEETGLQK